MGGIEALIAAGEEAGQKIGHPAQNASGIGIAHIVDPGQDHGQKALLPGGRRPVGAISARYPAFQRTGGFQDAILHIELHQLRQIGFELGIEIAAHGIIGRQDEGGIGEGAQRPGQAADLLPGLAMLADDQAVAQPRKLGS